MIQTLWPGHDENSAGDVAELMRKFDVMAERLQCAIVLIHHDSKAGSGDMRGTSRGAGSGVLSRDYDAAFLLTPHANEPDAVVVSNVIRNYPPREDIVAGWCGGHFVLLPDMPAIPETQATKQAKSQRGISNDDAADVAETYFDGGPLLKSELLTTLQKDVGLGSNKAYRIANILLETRGYREENRKEGKFVIPPERELMPCDRV